MATKVNQQWIEDVMNEYKETKTLERTTSYNKAIQALIIRLDREKINFKLYNLGAGVKKITTETDICPCCKKKISK